MKVLVSNPASLVGITNPKKRKKPMAKKRKSAGRKTSSRKRRTSNPVKTHRKRSSVRRRRNPATNSAGSGNIVQILLGAGIGYLGGNILGAYVGPMISKTNPTLGSIGVKAGGAFLTHQFGRKFIPGPVVTGLTVGMGLSIMTDLKKIAPIIPGLGYVGELGGFGDDIVPVNGVEYDPQAFGDDTVIDVSGATFDSVNGEEVTFETV